MWEKLPTEVMSLLRPTSNGVVEHPRQLPKRAQPDWERYIHEIEQYRELADDYDGQGASAPLSEVIDSAVCLARGFIAADLALPTYVVAGPSGTIDLVWDFEGGVSVSVEVIDSGQAEVILLEAGRPRQWVLGQRVEETVG